MIPRFLIGPQEGGVSNYGVHALTIIPYSLAFGLCGFFTLRSAKQLKSHNRRHAIQILGWLYVAVLLSTYPYKLNRLLDNTHIVIASVLFDFQMVVSIQLVRKVRRDWLNFALLAAQFLGFTLALASLIEIFHILFVAQLIASLAFAVILVRSLPQQ